MNLFIQFYIILCVALIVFDLVFLAVKNFKNYELYPRNTDFEAQLRKEIDLRRETGAFSEEFEKKYPAMLAKTKNLITLQTVLEEMKDAADWFRPAIYDQIDVYLKKTDYEQAYYTYIISSLDFANEPVPSEFAERFIAFLDSKSLYTFSNTMNAFYRFGQVNLTLLAIDKADERGKFYHKKLLTDGILASRTDQQELIEALTARFHQYSPHMQDCLLDIFRMGNGDASELCLELMCGKDTDEQVRYSAMRYFAKHPNEEARSFFLEILRDDQIGWVDQMLAVQALSRYSDREIYDAIKAKATSYHWHVRTNAVEYLHRQGISRDVLTDILRTQDKYAGEALLYQYRDDHEMTLFIIQTIQQIAQEAEMAKASANAPEQEGAMA